MLLGDAADGPLLATFHYGSVREIGGGEYERRSRRRRPHASSIVVSGGNPLQPELDAIAGGGRLLIDDSLTYAQTPVFKVDDVPRRTRRASCRRRRAQPGAAADRGIRRGHA